jgi:glycosyltransferase involved in cell wall biosynthesis
VCVLRPEKDLSTLLRAFATCARWEPRAFLVIVGDGPLRGELEYQARELGISARCWFQPAVADVVPWLSAIDVFVLPSRSEALSNSLMEAMAAECACIASRVGGNLELVQHGTTGLLFEKGDAQGLGDQMRLLLANPTLRRNLGRCAAASIGSKFSLGAAASRLGGIYEELA